MLSDSNAIAMIAVKDLGEARKFYENTLGLTAVDSQCEGVVAYRSGASVLNVYRSEYAGTNKATSVTFDVGTDVEETARLLKERGVPFEHYDMPDMQQHGDVYVSETMKVAWFKDPDGNILSIAGR